MHFVRKSYIYLLFYIFWEFLISSSRLLGGAVFKYFFFVITFLVFFICFSKTKKIFLTTDGQLWIPFLLWTIIGTFFHFTPGIFFIWGTAFLVMLIAVGNNMKVIFPGNIIFYFGAIQILGQFLQMEFTPLYNQIMRLVFVADYKEWGSGYQGFTTQTGTTGAILISSLGSYLYYHSHNKKIYINAFIIFLFFVFIFLTGKRSSTLIVISVPLLVLFLSTKKKTALIKYGIPSICTIILTLYVISTNEEIFENVRGIEKVSRGLDMFLGNEEIDLNGREELWEYALKGYRENPMFGIGVAQFKEWSGLNTNPHNMYIQILCEQGIAGLSCFIFPLLFCLTHTIILLRKDDENSPYRERLKFSLYIQLYFIIYGMSGNPTRNAFGYMMYFCAIGILQSYQYKYTQNDLRRFSNNRALI